MTQEDAQLFVDATQKKVDDHELQNNWTIDHCSTVPRTTKPIYPIWTFNRKQSPYGTLLKHKTRLCAHGGMQQQGTTY
jgi:hypothetical protein